LSEQLGHLLKPLSVLYISSSPLFPLVGVDAEVLQLAALAGGGAALAVVKTYAKKQISK
jgi:hypothetical protein